MINDFLNSVLSILPFNLVLRVVAREQGTSFERDLTILLLVILPLVLCFHWGGRYTSLSDLAQSTLSRVGEIHASGKRPQGPAHPDVLQINPDTRPTTEASDEAAEDQLKPKNTQISAQGVVKRTTNLIPIPTTITLRWRSKYGRRLGGIYHAGDNNF